MTKPASENQTRAMGFTTPQGYDPLSKGDDAITSNARAAAGHILQLRNALGGDPLPPLPDPAQLDWVDVGLKSGFAFRSGNPVQVAVDGYGLVHLRGNMDPAGFNTTDSTFVFATVPAWAIPTQEVRWLGFSTGTAGTPFGGWISASTGDMTLYADYVNATTRNAPTGHFSIIAQAWQTADTPAASVPDLHGTGSPLGVITPPRPGIIYTDTAGTLGAWRWIATGTTPNDWTVQYGDTGWRDVMSEGWLPDALNITATPQGNPGMRISRVNDTVTIQCDWTIGTAGSASGSLLMPSGWRPVGSDIHPMREWGTGADIGTFMVANNGRFYLYDVPAGARWMTSFSWRTDNPWPTSQLGTAHT